MLREKIAKLVSCYVKSHTLCQDSDMKDAELLVDQIEGLYFKYENGQAKLSIEEQKSQLKAWLEPYVEKHGGELLNEFYRYWTAHNPGGKKCRYKMEKIFDLPGRLRTWARNNADKEEKNRLVKKHEWLGK